MARSDKQLLVDSRQFATENRLRSWWSVISTAFLLGCLLVLAGSSISWMTTICSSIVAGFVMVRMFVLYHDFFHGAILKNSTIGRWIMSTFGMLILSPPAMWKKSHDDHHKNNCRWIAAEIGSFPVMTTEGYANASPLTRFGYRVVRNPLIIVFGYLTSFFWNKTLKNFLSHPIRNRAAGLALVLHGTLLVTLAMISPRMLIFGMLLPVFLASLIGTYLFYAQHNFPAMQRREGEDWDYVFAALKSSSHLKMGRIMNWMTGNIGFHHVHHLNARIPFYRLPEAMSELQELQNPGSTSLRLKDIYSCLRLKLWDARQNRMLSFREARTAA